jgi:hypothetical protein
MVNTCWFESEETSTVPGQVHLAWHRR